MNDKTSIKAAPEYPNRSTNSGIKTTIATLPNIVVIKYKYGFPRAIE